MASILWVRGSYTDKVLVKMKLKEESVNTSNIKTEMINDEKTKEVKKEKTEQIEEKTKENIKIEWMLKSWQSCLVSLNLDVDVAFFGDSITRGSNFQDYFNDVSVCNLGNSGDRVNDLIKRIDMITEIKPEKVFVLVGINNIIDKDSLEVFKSSYIKLIDNLKVELPSSTIYIQETVTDFV